VDLKHEFTVPASVEDTWKAFNDLEMVAGCFPGASLTSVDGDEFKGSCKVKLGPISLVYTGTGTFLERDGDAHRFVLEANGKDKRGNGTAGATVTAVLSDTGSGSTNASVTTDLSITGKPAQFGRGVIQDVSDKLLNQFVACLESKVGDVGEAERSDQPPAPPADVSDTLGESPVTAPRDVGEPPEPPAATQAAAARAGGGPSAPREEAREEVRENDALDLGATVVPILLRTYWRQLAGAVLVLLVLRRLLRRRP